MLVDILNFELAHIIEFDLVERNVEKLVVLKGSNIFLMSNIVFVFLELTLYCKSYFINSVY